MRKVNALAAPPASQDNLPAPAGLAADHGGDVTAMGSYHYADAAAGALPVGLQGGIAALSGISLDHVRVHYSSSMPAQLKAHAYARGSDIHLAPGQEQRLPHEAWHLVQQAQGRVAANAQANGVALNDDRRLEQEADVMGARAMRRGRAAPAPGEYEAAPAAGATPVTQLYRIEREPVTTQVYSVSDDNSMVTGMATPNHEFYVNNATRIGAMNNAISASPLLSKLKPACSGATISGLA
jgi:hypothetical protein